MPWHSPSFPQELGRPVHVCVWIHFLVRDTHGNNQWVAHYNSSGKLKRPYRNCKCSFVDMADVDPGCVYIRSEEIAHCMSVSDAAKTKAGREDPMKAISKHNVKLAFHHNCVPLSDPIHGLYKMLPPEGLHTTAEGTSICVMESLTGTIGKNAEGLRAATCIERVFLKLHHSLSRNSERDLPRGATTSGLLKSTRIWAYQRQGNMFQLLCVLHTTKVRKVLSPILEKKGLSAGKMVKLLKLYPLSPQITILSPPSCSPATLSSLSCTCDTPFLFFHSRSNPFSSVHLSQALRIPMSSTLGTL